MVNLFRRFQKPLMILVTTFTIISFTVFYSKQDFLEHGGRGRVGSVYGRDFTEAQYVREQRKYDLCQGLLFELWQTLIQPATTQEEAVGNYVWNSVVLRHESDQLGIQPTEGEIETAIKTLPVFQTNGVYDSFKYNNFVQNALNSRGMTPDVLEELVGNDIRLKRLQKLLGTTLAAAPTEVRSIFEQSHSKMECSVIRFDFAEFLQAQQPTEEDVKKAYEERKSTLRTDEQRKVKFVALKVAPSEKPLAGKEKVDAFEKLSGKALEIMVAMAEKEAKLEDVAAKAGAQVQETQPFPLSAPPAELDQSPAAAAAAFKLTKAEPNSDAIQTDKGYVILQLAEIVPAREKTFNEARTALLDSLKQERGQEAMNLKATEVRNKIEADLKAGKSLVDAAAAAGVKADPVPPFALADPPSKEKDSRMIMLAARDLQEGQISSLIPTGAETGTGTGGGLLVYLAKRLPVDEKEFEENKGRIAEQVSDAAEYAVFREWLRARRAAANILVVRQPRT